MEGRISQENISIKYTKSSYFYIFLEHLSEGSNSIFLKNVLRLEIRDVIPVSRRLR
ncbi:hypothetical protein P689_122207 [Candidatus Riesia pediculischaeffi PTSU]|uniref:Uncharacterized protein n=1 Tax=Candidatus Riesia pediculischaeffi PTSU TaxID=1401651 RepID=A0A0C1V859_9ENTR|nr:hypothetical protein P689_122207 [Candidatus Riesia pediculischaeffi PTSU]